MNQMRDRFAFGVLTGCLMLFGACALEGGPPGSEPTSTSVSAVLVQSCPGYDSCASWSGWQEVGTPYCSGSDQCPPICDPLPGRPEYCDTEIVPTSDCCTLLPGLATFTTMERYQWCWNRAGDMCEKIDRTAGLVGCGC